eukprot:UN25477
MSGKTDSLYCLRKEDCLPIGGHSVVSSFTEIKPNTPKILITTKMDTTALFRTRQAVGAEDAMSGLTSVLYAI